jgi:hypothetical protein
MVLTTLGCDQKYTTKKKRVQPFLVLLAGAYANCLLGVRLFRNFPKFFSKNPFIIQEFIIQNITIQEFIIQMFLKVPWDQC